MDHYRSYQVSPALRQYIDCVWAEDYFDQPTNKGRHHLIVPDNTVELVISEHPVERQLAGRGEVQYFNSHLSGLKTQPQKIKLCRSCLLSIRFHPHGLSRLTGLDARQFVDRNYPAEQIFGPEFKLLEEQLLETENWKERLERIERFFYRKLSRRLFPDDPLFEAFLLRLESGKGNLPIAELALQLNVSIKTLERKCLQHLGVTPKKYSRLIRLFHALSSTSRNRDLKLTDIAYRNGYYDQMHFIKEVKEFTGMVPGSFFQEDRGIQRAIFTQHIGIGDLNQ